MQRNIDDVNIESFNPLVSPAVLKNEFPVTQDMAERVAGFRQDISGILSHEDNRFLVITGPCSIHDPQAAMEYADRLAILRERYSDTLNIVMRVYFEKPRTTLGWRGMIVDPHMDGSYRIEEGLREARRLLLAIAEKGVPAGTEVLDPIIPQYIADLVSWAAIGARTTESQTHREITSGLSMPVGFKNGTDGSVAKAVNAIQSSLHGHSFIGIDQNGRTSVISTRGNRTGHLIMRGGADGPNYYEEDVEKSEDLLSGIGIRPSILIDCSHANSGKKHEKQSRIFRAALDLRSRGRGAIRGVMLESNLMPGQQDIQTDRSLLKYGVSITDSCIGWDETEKLIAKAAEQLA